MKFQGAFCFFPQLMKYTEQRMLTLNEHCVICDERHVFQNGPMLKVQTLNQSFVAHNLVITIFSILMLHMLCVFFLSVSSASSLQPGAVCLFLPHPGSHVRSYRRNRHWRRGRFAHLSIICCKAHGIRVCLDQIRAA